MDWWILVFLSTHLDCTDAINQEAQLLLNVHLVRVVHLETDVLDGVISEALCIFLCADEEWQCDLMQNCLDMLTHKLPRNSEAEALCQELK